MNKRGLDKKIAASRKWSPKKGEIEWLYTRQLWSQEKIAAHFGVSQTAMAKIMRRLGVESLGRARRGPLNGRYKDGSQSTLYRLIIAKDKCSKCGVTERLVVHHRNGEHQDNHIENLQVLCESCHNSLTKRLWWAARRSSV